MLQSLTYFILLEIIENQSMNCFIFFYMTKKSDLFTNQDFANNVFDRIIAIESVHEDFKRLKMWTLINYYSSLHVRTVPRDRKSVV